MDVNANVNKIFGTTWVITPLAMTRVIRIVSD